MESNDVCGSIRQWKIGWYKWYDAVPTWDGSNAARERSRVTDGDSSSVYAMLDRSARRMLPFEDEEETSKKLLRSEKLPEGCLLFW